MWWRHLIALLLAMAVTSAAQEGGVAVWDFDNASFEEGYEDLSPLLTELLIDQLASRGLKVVERERLTAVLAEQHLGSSDLVDEATQLRLGRIVGARRMIFGSYLVVGGQIQITVRLVDVETSLIERSVEGIFPLERLEEGLRKLTEQLLEGNDGRQ